MWRTDRCRPEWNLIENLRNFSKVNLRTVRFFDSTVACTHRFQLFSENFSGTSFQKFNTILSNVHNQSTAVQTRDRAQEYEKPRVLVFNFYTRSQNCEKRLLASPCPSATRPNGTARFPRDVFFMKFYISVCFRISVEKIKVFLIHWGRVTQICVFTLQLCKTDDANLRF